MDLELVKYLFPSGVLEYFDISSHKTQGDQVHFYLEEKNKLPIEFRTEIAKSKGFTPEITVEDFPLRGKPVLLHIKRRRWTLVESKKIVKRDWQLVANGTRMTTEFASFLKGIIG
ncbi:MAG: transposase [Flavobacteriales bacterium]|nr:transposase [Flavobacteriales bacterium]